MGRRRKRIVKRAAAALGVVLVAAGIIGGCTADELVLGHNRQIIDPAGAKQRFVQAGGKKIECWVARSARAADREPEALVLFFTGKMDRADRWTSAVADGWGEWPVEVWGMNYPGSGGSDGPVRMATVGADADAVFDEMSKQAHGRPIFVQAASFGTTVALHVGARRPVSGLVLQNPAPLRQLIRGQYGWWNLWLVAYPVSCQIPQDLDAVANARQCRAPAIFMNSGADEIIPARFHQMVIDAYAGEKRVIDMPTAVHNSPLTREAAEELGKDRQWLFGMALNSH